MKFETVKKFFHNRLYLSVIALCASVLLGTGAVFAWFLLGNTTELGSTDTGIVSGSEIGMEISVDGEEGSLTFNEAAPGKEYKCDIRFYNNTSQAAYFDLDFLGIVSSIGTEFDVSFLNVFAVKGVRTVGDAGSETIEAETEFVSLARRMALDGTYPDPDRENVRILSRIPIAAGGSDQAGTQQNVTIYIKFMEQVFADDGSVMDNVDINIFQGKQFRIGQIKVSTAA